MTLKMTVGAAVVAVAGFCVLACNSSSSPTMPSPTPGGGGGGGGAAVTISITGIRGGQSFSPNPATVTAGQTVMWVNNDTTTHRIVQDAGAFDTGNLAPGASSAPITITSAAAMPFHCAIHPSMVGTINGSSSAGGGGGGY